MLFPHLRGLRVGQVEDTGDAVVIRASCRAAQAQRPACGAVSSRVHGGYARVVADGAAGGRPVLIALSVRRFRCPEPSCPKATFAEQAEGGCLKDQPAAGDVGDKDAPAVPDGSLDVCGRERQLAVRTRERYAEIRERLDAGQPEAAIRRATGLDRRTVQQYARAASADELLAGAMNRESRLDEFKPYICQRWNQGLTDASQIHAELRQRGWTGSPQTVRRYVHLLGQAGAAVMPAPAVPKTRQITRWLLSRPGSLDADDQAHFAAVRAGCPHLDALAGHIRDFAGMMTRRQGLLALEDWLTRVEADDQPELHSLAAGIRRDQQAVTAGLALPYSSAAMEGNVNKIKMIKRQMYGRAGFALLLRKRVILHPA